jgi:hypothetical protein
MDKWNYMKLKSFCMTKKWSLNRRDHPQSGRKSLLATHQTRDSLTIIDREFKKLNSPKMNELITNRATELNRTFSKEEVQMAKKHIKKCSPFLAIKESKSKPH